MSRTEYNRNWRAKNRAHVNAEQRKARAKNPERYRDYDKKSYYSDEERRRAKSRKTLYGITRTEWDRLFAGQGHACAICRAPEPGGKRTWNTDHCHKTGPVRGILCKRCNVVLGYVKDDIDLLNKLAAYLSRSTPA